MIICRFLMNFDLNTHNDTGVHSLAKQITHILPAEKDSSALRTAPCFTRTSHGSKILESADNFMLVVEYTV
jgi:hypothetical protein